MKTMERTVSDTAPPVPRSRPKWLMTVAILLAVALGALGGWVAAKAFESDPKAVVAGGGGLSDRQQQMVDVMDAYTAAWRTGDAAAVGRFFTPSGVFVFNSTEYPVADGSLAQFVSGGSWGSLTPLEPYMIDGDVVTVTTTWNGVHATNVVRFTASGAVLVVRHLNTTS